jgi:hypothetical protein
MLLGFFGAPKAGKMGEVLSASRRFPDALFRHLQTPAPRAAANCWRAD